MPLDPNIELAEIKSLNSLICSEDAIFVMLLLHTHNVIHLAFFSFVSLFIQIERRIYYDEVEGLTVDWLDATSTLVLSMCMNSKRSCRKGSPGKWRAFEELVSLSCPYDLKISKDEGSNECNAANVGHGMAALDREPSSGSENSKAEIEPAVFPLTVRLLSTIPVALHAVGGDDRPLDIGVRLYMSSYFR